MPGFVLRLRAEHTLGFGDWGFRVFVPVCSSDWSFSIFRFLHHLTSGRELS